MYVSLHTDNNYVSVIYLITMVTNPLLKHCDDSAQAVSNNGIDTSDNVTCMTVVEPA